MSPRARDADFLEIHVADTGMERLTALREAGCSVEGGSFGSDSVVSNGFHGRIPPQEATQGVAAAGDI